MGSRLAASLQLVHRRCLAPQHRLLGYDTRAVQIAAAASAEKIGAKLRTAQVIQACCFLRPGLQNVIYCHIVHAGTRTLHHRTKLAMCIGSHCPCYCCVMRPCMLHKGHSNITELLQLADGVPSSSLMSSSSFVFDTPGSTSPASCLDAVGGCLCVFFMRPVLSVGLAREMRCRMRRA